MRDHSWFPGRWIGGGSLALGPLLLLIGVVLRIPFNFFFPAQLAAFDGHPVVMAASYGTFAAGNVLLWPGIVTLALLISAKEPSLAVWGGTLAILALIISLSSWSASKTWNERHKPWPTLTPLSIFSGLSLLPSFPDGSCLRSVPTAPARSDRSVPSRWASWRH